MHSGTDLQSVWYSLGVLVAFTPANNKIYLVPFRWHEVQSWDQIAIDVTTLEAGKVGRLGVYVYGPDGLPGRKVLQTSELSLASVAVVTDSVTLTTVPPGVFLAFAGDSSSAVLESVSPGGLLGRATASGTISKMLSYSLTYSSGDDLPNTISSPTYETTDAPLIALRAS